VFSTNRMYIYWPNRTIVLDKLPVNVRLRPIPQFSLLGFL